MGPRRRVRCARRRAGARRPSTCPPEVLARVAHATHPWTRVHDVDEPNPAWHGARHLLAREPALAHLHPDAQTRDVTSSAAPSVRARFASYARSAGAARDTVRQVVLAGHEALLTATGRHGAARPTHPEHRGSVRLYLRRAGEQDPADTLLLIDVDDGPPDSPPGPDALLPIADAACPDVSIARHPLTPTRSRIRLTARST